jgi:hypothetical protein
MTITIFPKRAYPSAFTRDPANSINYDYAGRLLGFTWINRVGVRGVTIGSEHLGALALRGDEASEPHPPLHNIVGNAGRGLVIIGGVGQAGSAEGGSNASG